MSEKAIQLLNYLGLSPDQVDLKKVESFFEDDQEKIRRMFELLRAPFPNEAIDYKDREKKKSPYISHEWYRKRLLDVFPEEVKFEIHSTDIKTFEKSGIETSVAVAHCSLQIYGWRYDAVGTSQITFLRDNDAVPTDLGGNLKSAVTNAFTNCCKAFFMGTEQLLKIKGEKVPGDTLGHSIQTPPPSTKLFPDTDPLVGDVCVKCQTPRRKSDVDFCKEVQAGKIAYCKSCVPAHMKKRAGKIY
jgi:hypothetical protein